ncbi:hypothetical protein AGMMS49543_27510 [Betaproteobacteria bacterium]|nr:hypothetical protein AGMMS49543_27510 [Betaproteobacteria bacterium]
MSWSVNSDYAIVVLLPTYARSFTLDQAAWTTKVGLLTYYTITNVSRET